MPPDRVFDKPLARPRLHDEIVDILQKQILTRELVPGAKLPPEREMSEILGVNRATVREAMRKLESLELVEIRQGDGVHVKDFRQSGNLELVKAALVLDQTHETLFNVLEVRRIVVPEMASLAAKRRGAADLAELEAVIKARDLSMLERDIQVHQVIARASQNLLYSILLNFFNRLFVDEVFLYFDNENNVERSARFHQDIYRAIQGRQAVKARRIMLDVLLYVEKVLREALGEGTKKEKGGRG